MIRVVHFLRRKTSLGFEEFTRYSLEQHGPMVAAHQTRLGMLRHVRTSRDPSAEALDDAARIARGQMELPFDGIAETWWASQRVLVDALETPAGRDALAALVKDEDRFIDLAASPLWVAIEYPQVSVLRDRPRAASKSGIVKLSFALRSPSTMDRTKAQAYWLTNHGPLVRSHAIARGMICYQQVHACERETSSELHAARGTQIDDYIGHAEAWFDRLLPRAGPEVDRAAAAAIEDEANFIDWSRSSLFTGKEAIFVDRDWL